MQNGCELSLLEKPCLYFVTEPPNHAGAAKAALEGGANAVQLRDKEAKDSELLPVARKLKKLCEKHGATFIINDRVALAKKCGAHGVHVGQEDLKGKSVASVRAKLFPHAIVGATVHNVQEALLAFEEGADYVGASPIFATKSKADAGKPIGISGLKKIVRALRERNARIPVIAIGGIDAKNAGEVMKAGADGIAVVSAITRAKNPVAAAKKLSKIVSASSKSRRETKKFEGVFPTKTL